MTDEIRCPICEKQVFYKYQITGKDKVDNFWLHCSCHVLFNLKNPDYKDVFNGKYKEEYEKMKGVKERFSYYIRTYMNFMEEITYGRKFLDVGFCLDYNIKEMRERGWLATGIDLIENTYITGDFETYNFKRERFDLIFMCDVVQCFRKPVEAIYKAYNLLSPQGLLFIVTPNTDLLFDAPILEWANWGMLENRLFFPEKVLLDIISRCDREMSGRFKVVLKHSTVSKRFVSFNNAHILVQKQKIEEINNGLPQTIPPCKH